MCHFEMNGGPISHIAKQPNSYDVNFMRMDRTNVHFLIKRKKEDAMPIKMYYGVSFTC